MQNYNVMDVNGINTLTGAQDYLILVSSNKQIVEEIKNIICNWNYKSEFNLEVIKCDLDAIIQEIIQQHFYEEESDEIVKAIACVVYNEIYENLIPLVRGNYSREDLFLYEQCQYFCKQNVTPGEFGSCVYNSLPFTAAIVELSVLDNYKSPLEKIRCLCYTYDLIYADLKLALASIISKYSEKELEIPVINNDEVIPILTLVIIKSKLMYLSSNLFYINFFGERLIKEDGGIRTILDAFGTVIQRLMKSDKCGIQPFQDKLAPQLGLRETMEIMSDAENLTEGEVNTIKLIDEEKKRLVSLITTSTTERDFIPFDLPKLFT